MTLKTNSDFNMPLAPLDDYRHVLEPGEHEAFYFLFTSPEGSVFGFLRTLFDRETVLELVALRVGDRVWVHQQRTALSEGPVAVADASGPSMTLACREPWQAWGCFFHSTVQEAAGENVVRADLDLEFVATNAPALYRFGPYLQAQQDGRLDGRLQVGTKEWAGELLCYRDHSWGRRPMGAAAGWTVANALEHFYVVVVETGGGEVCFGRLATPDGQVVPVHAPKITAAERGWRIEDPEAGLGTWYVQRLSPPLKAYLGPAGQEAVRDAPSPGDLYLDELGPALFSSSEGKQVIGFLEQMRRLSWSSGC